MGNSDPFLTYLKAFGYSVVRLPRADIRPLQILVKQDARLTRLGDLATVLRPGPQVGLPHVKENTPAANISGERTRELSIGVGLSLLGSVITAMGGSKIGLDVTYKNARTASFEFASVLEDRVELTELDQYLTNADISPFSTHVAELLEADAIYVTVSTIKTQTFIVDAKQSDGTAVDLQVPVIQATVGGNVKVSGSGSTASKVTYQGPIPLVFGFQAARLVYENGRYTAFTPSKPGDDTLERVGTTKVVPDYLVTESPFVRLDLK
jgi:hypothetical protein